MLLSTRMYQDWVLCLTQVSLEFRLTKRQLESTVWTFDRKKSHKLKSSSSQLCHISKQGQQNFGKSEADSWIRGDSLSLIFLEKSSLRSLLRRRNQLEVITLSLSQNILLVRPKWKWSIWSKLLFSCCVDNFRKKDWRKWANLLPINANWVNLLWIKEQSRK